jgi:hypothetical protein
MGQQINTKPTGVGTATKNYLIPVVDPTTGQVYKVTMEEFLIIMDQFSPLSGTTWDGYNKTVTLTGATAITLASTRIAGVLKVTQDSTGARTLSINGTTLTINAGANTVTLIGFMNQNGTYILNVNGSAVILGVQPASDTNPIVDDTLDTFNWTNNPLFPNVSDREYSLNGAPYTDVTAKPIPVTGNVAIGQLLMRIKALGSNPASTPITNATAFTGSSYDTAAQAYFDAVTAAGGTLSTGDKDAFNTWVVGRKNAGTWTKYNQIYPMMGGVAGAHAINAKSPGTNNLTFSGSWTHNTSGADPDGIAGTKADTGVTINSMAQNDHHFSIYINENTTGAFDMGMHTVTAEIQLVALFGGTFRGCSFEVTQGTVANANAIGYYIVSRVASNQFLMSKSGTVNTIVQASAAPGTNPTMYLGDNNGSSNPSSRREAFATIGLGLTSGEMTSESTAMATLQTALGRA